MKTLRIYPVPTKGQIKDFLSVLKELHLDDSLYEGVGAASPGERKDHLLVAIDDSRSLLAALGAVVPDTRADCIREIVARIHDSEGSLARRNKLEAEMLETLERSRDAVYQALWALYYFKTADSLRTDGRLEDAIGLVASGATSLARACVTAIAHEASVAGGRKSDSRHQKNRERKAEGLALWRSKRWKVDADGIRAIQQCCNVTYKTAERWVLEWKKVASQ